MSEEEPATGSWERWPEEMSRQAESVVEHVRAGSPLEAMDALDRMIVDLNSRRATVAELANTMD